jgi:hypothetical protein
MLIVLDSLTHTWNHAVNGRRYWLFPGRIILTSGHSGHRPQGGKVASSPFPPFPTGHLGQGPLSRPSQSPPNGLEVAEAQMSSFGSGPLAGGVANVAIEHVPAGPPGHRHQPTLTATGREPA